MKHKENYYAALERQRAAESTLRDRLGRSTESESSEVEALESLYTEVGMKAFTAFNSCLEWLSHLGRGNVDPSAVPRVEESVRDAVENGLDGVRQDMAAIRERLGRLEGNIAALEAGMRRIDKFTLEAFRNIQEIEERFRNVSSTYTGEGSHSHETRGRLPKEEAAKLALDAGARMRAEGKRITLAAVAREAGLKYGQIVYAFGNKDGFLNELDKAVDDRAADSEAGAQSPPPGAGARDAGYEETASA